MKCHTMLACLGLVGLSCAHAEEEPDKIQFLAEEGLIEVDAAVLDLEGIQLGGHVQVVEGLQIDGFQVQDLNLRIQLGDGIQFNPNQLAIPETEAIPEEYAKHEKVTMIIENMEHQEGGLGYLVTFRIINPTKELMQFPGMSEKRPKTQKQLWRKDEWVEPKGVEHSTNISIRKCRIEPGQSAVFQATFTIDEMPARVGVGYSNGHHNGKHMKVWSEKIGR